MHRIIGGACVLAITAAIPLAGVALQTQAEANDPSRLWALTVALFIVAVGTGLWWLRTRPAEAPAPTPAPAVSAGRDAVVSINQSGGVTAHTVTNLGLHPRVLPVAQLPDFKTRLAQYAGTPIRVFTLVLNPEAHRFAADIERLLKSAGWTITHPLNATLLEAPTAGVMVRSTAKTIEEIPAALNELGHCLKDAGFSVVVFFGAQEDGDSVVVYDNGSVNRSIFDAVVELP